MMFVTIPPLVSGRFSLLLTPLLLQGMALLRHNPTACVRSFLTQANWQLWIDDGASQSHRCYQVFSHPAQLDSIRSITQAPQSHR